MFDFTGDIVERDRYDEILSDYESESAILDAVLPDSSDDGLDDGSQDDDFNY